jgi:hypothetical protein
VCDCRNHLGVDHTPYHAESACILVRRIDAFMERYLINTIADNGIVDYNGNRILYMLDNYATVDGNNNFLCFL